MNKFSEKYTKTTSAKGKSTSKKQESDSPISIFDTIQTILERFNRMESKVDQLWNIANELSSVSILDTTPEITTAKQPELPVADKVDEVSDSIEDSMPNSNIQELEVERLIEGSQKDPLQEKKYDKEKICDVIVELKDNKNMSWTDISRELKKMGYTPENEDKDTFHHLVVSNLYKYAKKNQLSEPLPETFIEPVQKTIPESKAKEKLSKCHGKELSTAERDKFLLQVEKMFPGIGQNGVRADALNKSGILTGRGVPWTAKKLTDNLRLAKKRIEKKDKDS